MIFFHAHDLTSLRSRYFSFSRTPRRALARRLENPAA
jgi:hypothetical protein